MIADFSPIRGIEKPRILFTGGGGAGSEALNRIFRDRYDIFFADANYLSRPNGIDVSQWFEIPVASAAQFSASILELCKTLSINLLVPGVDEELVKCSRLERFDNFDVLLPAEQFIETHLDKMLSNISLNQSLIPAPKTVSADDCSLDFPCIVKPKTGRGSRNVAEVMSIEELNSHILLSRLEKEIFVLQELLEGEEFTIMMLADRNCNLRAVVPILVKTKRGITIEAITCYDPIVINSCKTIHNKMPTRGYYNIQLIKTNEGFAKPFEINPRISTTACLCAASGIDFLGLFLGIVGGAQPKGRLSEFKDGVRLKRSWYNEFSN